MSKRHGFTIIEIALAVAVTSTLATIAVGAIGPRRVFLKVSDTQRSRYVQQLQNALEQYLVAHSTLPNQDAFGEGEDQKRPICKLGMTRDSSCINLDPLVASGYVLSLPEDSVEPCPTYTGYDTFLLRNTVQVEPTYLGKLRGDPVSPRCILDTVAPAITDIAVSLSADTATITWRTDELSNSRVEYGIAPTYGNLTTINSTLTEDHSEMLTGLSSFTTYHFRVLSRDTAGNLAQSSNGSFATADATPPEFLGPPAVVVTPTSATVTWTTDEASTSQVEYGPTVAYGSLTLSNDALVTDHNHVVSGLTPDTLYHYRVLSRDASGNLGSSGDFTFTTLPDTAPPIIANVGTLVVGNSVTISWDTNEAADAQVAYGLDPSYGNLSPLDSTLQLTHSVTLTGLINDTLYHYQILSRDAAGNLAESANLTVTIQDTTPPTISALSVGAINHDSSTVTWNTDEAATSQVEYGTVSGTYTDTTTLDTNQTTSHSQLLGGLRFSTVYYYRALSRDAAGNLVTSPEQSFTTSNIITSFSASPLANSATITWTTIIPANTQVQYGPTVAMGSITPLDPVMRTTGHTRTLTGLAPGTLYYFRMLSGDASGNLATLDSQFTTSGDATPPTISAISISNRNTPNPTITWNTNEPADSEVEFGLSNAYGSTSGLNPTLVTAGHSRTLNGLTMNTTYYYRIRSRDAAGNLGTSAGTFVTDDIPPVLTLPPTITGLTGNSATINWSVNESSAPRVEYGLTPSYGSLTGFGSNSVPAQSRTLTGLQPNVQYHYRVRSRDAAQNLSPWSGDYTFVTDVSGPTISGVSSSTTQNSATITWGTNEPATSQVEYGLTTAYGNTTTLDSTLVTSHSQGLTGLQPNTQYHYRVRSQDGAGNTAVSSDRTFTTTDTAPPIITSGPTTLGVTAATATIGWETNEPSTTQVQYGQTTAYENGMVIDATLVTSHSRTLTGLLQDWTYHYRVLSRDAAGNLTTSGDFTFQTDGTPPQFSDLSASATSSTATITWGTNEPATSQVEYGLTTAYGNTTTLDSTLVTSHSQGLTGLQPNTQYHYRVQSQDAAGNLGMSADGTFSTQP
jgi:phosphodiesterase/alkaline phosphatase D-like protein/type II secretory pathway pseudopilin PulG